MPTWPWLMRFPHRSGAAQARPAVSGGGAGREELSPLQPPGLPPVVPPSRPQFPKHTCGPHTPELHGQAAGTGGDRAGSTQPPDLQVTGRRRGGGDRGPTPFLEKERESFPYYQLPGTTMTNDYKLCSLNDTNVLPYYSRGQRSLSEVTRLKKVSSPFWRLEGRICFLTH